MNLQSSLLVVCALLGSACLAAETPALQPLETIQAAAEAHIRSQLPGGPTKLFVTANTLDSRLRFERCTMPLEASANEIKDSARATVGVRCRSGNTWTVYVPVAIEIESLVLVLRRAVPRGTRLQSTDVEVQARRFPGLGTHFITDVAQLSGRRLRRPLRAGEAIPVEALAAEVLVERGQKVTLIASASSFEIRATGTALTDGAAADRIRVQNLSSNKIVEGIVEQDGVVRVAP